MEREGHAPKIQAGKNLVWGTKGKPLPGTSRTVPKETQCERWTGLGQVGSLQVLV